MPTITSLVRDEITRFLQHWPYSRSYLAQLATRGNDKAISRLFKTGGDLELGTADKILAFIRSYRIDPDETMRRARSELARQRAKHKKTLLIPPRRGTSTRRARVVA